MNILKSIAKTYNSLSFSGQLLLFCIIFLGVLAYFQNNFKLKEKFTQKREFEFKEGAEIYDKFYADIYDYLVFNGVKNDYEIGQFVNKTTPTEQSIILDIGSGTGHHVSALQKQGYKAIGLDSSENMIKRAKEIYPEYDFRLGDALNAGQFNSGSFTHILCLYFTIYYMEDKAQFFSNCMNWLMPGGYLVVHLVDREMFDPILPLSNPLMYFTPQRYAEKRITKSSITFDDFKYDSNFELSPRDNSAMFVEKFRNRSSGKVFRKQEHKMYMEPEKQILQLAQDAGFILEGEIDLIRSGYEYNKLYILMKPN
jgi:SAM-dependent methyltransferase